MLSTTFGMDMVGSADSPGSQKSAMGSFMSTRHGGHHVSESPKARASSSLRSATTPHFLSKAPTSASTEWLFRSFTHPKNGSSNFTKATYAAIKIQKLYRGRIARAHFLHMYEHRHALYHMLIYLIFYVILIMYVLFKKTSIDGFYMQHLMKDLLVEEEFPEQTTQIYKKFDDVATAEEFWQFLEGPFANNVFPGDCYESPVNMSKPCVGTLYGVNIMLGGVRMRLLRVDSQPCETSLKVIEGRTQVLGCKDYWDHETNSDATFLPPNGPSRSALDSFNLSTCFQYTDPTPTLLTTREYGFRGFLYDPYYSSGGFVCDLPYERGDTVAQQLQALREANWIDLQTRAVLIELGTINMNGKMSTSCRLTVEFLPTGGVVPHYTFSTAWIFSLYQFRQVFTYWSGVAILSAYCMGYFYVELLEISDSGCAYFLDMWNVMDLGNLTLLLFSLIVDITAILLERDILSARSDSYVDLHGLNYLNDTGNWFQSLNIMMLTLKMFKYLKVSPKLSLLLRTIVAAGNTLALFTVILILTLVGFAVSFYCAFNAELDVFRTMVDTTITLIRGLLGTDGINYDEINHANRILGPVLFVMFYFVVSIIFFSLFITIIDEAYSNVKEELEKHKSSAEEDMILDRIRSLKHRMQRCIGRCFFYASGGVKGRRCRRHCRRSVCNAGTCCKQSKLPTNLISLPNLPVPGHNKYLEKWKRAESRKRRQRASIAGDLKARRKKKQALMAKRRRMSAVSNPYLQRASLTRLSSGKIKVDKSVLEHALPQPSQDQSVPHLLATVQEIVQNESVRERMSGEVTALAHLVSTINAVRSEAAAQERRRDEAVVRSLRGVVQALMPHIQVNEGGEASSKSNLVTRTSPASEQEAQSLSLELPTIGSDSEEGDSDEDSRIDMDIDKIYGALSAGGPPATAHGKENSF